MHILCTICSDIVSSAENIYATKCGHLFHHHCLSQWIARSKTCPQCRNKVTSACMFRLFPTVSSDATLEDATTLQSRLDDAQLQLRQHRARLSDLEDKVKAAADKEAASIKKLQDSQNRLVSKESAITGLQEQLLYLKVQNKETMRLRDENEQLKKNMQTLTALQAVLNASAAEVEGMLAAYSDVRTVATFATALKRALCDSESKKAESRAKLQEARSQLAVEKSNVASLHRDLSLQREANECLRSKLEEINGRHVTKRGAPQDADSWPDVERDAPSPKLRRAGTQPVDSPNTSVGTLARRIEQAESPYLQLQRSSLALAALQQRRPAAAAATGLKPAEQALFNAGKAAVASKSQAAASPYSIFHSKQAAREQLTGVGRPAAGAAFDGLGGHARLDPAPAPRPTPAPLPRVSARHRLRRPDPNKTHPRLDAFLDQAYYHGKPANTS
ncbi:E3 ubiquitin-protein ligase TRAIP [Plutella xylostella]|uniref:E3 ubiquitin-protein ligase TRAIP n=1 Tax=Plutella xylostella TaxID=51655 RepID=UPI00203244DB|nr:E3 ubiquitin-protein ligase TRAIP [Plutella xylostella]